MLARGFPGVLNFLTIYIYTRLLPPDEYGRFAIIVAAGGLANIVFFQWLRLGVLRLLPQDQPGNLNFLSTVASIYFRLVLISAAIAIIPLLYVWTDLNLVQAIVLTTFTCWGLAWYEVNLDLANINLQPQRYGLLSLTKSLVAFALGFTLIYYFHLGMVGALIGLIVGMLLAGLIFRVPQWGQLDLSLGLRNKEIVNQLLTYGMPLSITVALTFVIQSSDRMLIALMLGTDSAGLYSVGYDIAQQSLGLLMSIASLAGYPMIVHSLERDGLNLVRKKIERYGTILFAIAIPATMALAVLAPNIAMVFVGEEFRVSTRDLVPLIAFGVLLSGIKSFYFDLSFQLGKKTSVQIWIALIAAILNVVLNIHWIPIFGIVGSAYATIASYGIGIILSILFGMRVFKLPLWNSSWFSIVNASTLMAFFLWVMPSNEGWIALIGQVGLGILFYLIYIFIFNVGGMRTYTFKIIHRN